jgi:hypothetical protein
MALSQNIGERYHDRYHDDDGREVYGKRPERRFSPRVTHHGKKNIIMGGKVKRGNNVKRIYILRSRRSPRAIKKAGHRSPAVMKASI